jgi:hypothetical protein
MDHFSLALLPASVAELAMILKDNILFQPLIKEPRQKVLQVGTRQCGATPKLVDSRILKQVEDVGRSLTRLSTYSMGPLPVISLPAE